MRKVNLITWELIKEYFNISYTKGEYISILKSNECIGSGWNNKGCTFFKLRVR